jgi:hypothetical protein
MSKYASLTKDELKALCSSVNLATKGNKTDLMKRLSQHHNVTPPESPKLIELTSSMDLPSNGVTDMQNITTFMEAMLTKFVNQFKEQNEKALDLIKTEMFDLCKKVDSLEAKCGHLQQENKTLKQQLANTAAISQKAMVIADDMQQQQLNNVISVVYPSSSSLNLGDISSQIKIDSDSVTLTHSFVSKNKNFKTSIIKVNNQNTKSTFFKNRALLFEKHKIKIYESLTENRSKLLTEARKLCSDNKITSAWSFNGQIFIKKTVHDKQGRKISALADLANLG